MKEDKRFCVWRGFMMNGGPSISLSLSLSAFDYF